MHPPRDELPEQLDSPPLNRRLWIIAGGLVVLLVVAVVGIRLASSHNSPRKTSSSRPAVAHNLAPHRIGAPIVLFTPNPENAATAPMTPATAPPPPPTTNAP